MNLVLILKYLLKKLDPVQFINKEAIIAIGNTGCGKSTMLNALMYGPLEMEEVKLELEAINPRERGSSGMKRGSGGKGRIVKVIDLKE